MLVVLDRPEVPLNTNGSENDIRAMVTRRKLSAGTRSQSGKQARMVTRRKLSAGTRSQSGKQARGLMKTCRKLGISYWHYLGDRLQVPNATPVVNGGVKMYRRGGAKVSHGLGGSLSR